MVRVLPIMDCVIFRIYITYVSYEFTDVLWIWAWNHLFSSCFPERRRLFLEMKSLFSVIILIAIVHYRARVVVHQECGTLASSLISPYQYNDYDN